MSPQIGWRSLLLASVLGFMALGSPPANAAGLLSCYVMGDSLAVGTAQKLPWCWSNAKVGLNTKRALTRFTKIPPADVTVISLGINDRGTRLPTVRNLTQIRQRVHSPRVIWVLPADVGKGAEIRQVAIRFNDRVIDLGSSRFRRYLSHVDHLHPSGAGYVLIANKARELAFAR